LQADYVTVVEDRPRMSVKYCLPVPVFHFGLITNAPWGYSAIAEHLVSHRWPVASAACIGNEVNFRERWWSSRIQSSWQNNVFTDSQMALQCQLWFDSQN